MFKRKNRLENVAEIDVTTFMNLMVILVPFLLVVAVFSRLSVLQLQLPSKDAVASEPLAFALQLELMPEQWILRSNDKDEITRLPAPNTPAQWRQFEDALLEIKSRFPTEKSITLFFHGQVPYKHMLEVMDHVRQSQVVSGTQAQWVELFPDISLGRQNPELIQPAAAVQDAQP